MVALPDLVFYGVVTALVVHELDAIREREWRFFFAAVPVHDRTAYRTFAALHAPLLVAILWGVDVPALRLALDGFVVVHAGLHFALRNHPLIGFGTWFSRVWIYGGAVLGALHLALVL